jgi:hypothetical protein
MKAELWTRKKKLKGDNKKDDGKNKGTGARLEMPFYHINGDFTQEMMSNITLYKLRFGSCLLHHKLCTWCVTCKVHGPLSYMAVLRCETALTPAFSIYMALNLQQAAELFAVCLSTTHGLVAEVTVIMSVGFHVCGIHIIPFFCEYQLLFHVRNFHMNPRRNQYRP